MRTCEPPFSRVSYTTYIAYTLVVFGGFFRGKLPQILASVSDVQARLGARVRDWRQQRGWTQEALGERAGLSYKFIGEIERGVGNPTIDSIDQIARAFSIDIGLLLHREAPEPAYTPLSSDDFAVMREARDSLDSALKRLGGPGKRRPRARRK